MLEKLKSLVNKWLQRIEERNDQKYKEEISKLNTELDVCLESISILEDENSLFEKEILSLLERLADKGKHSSLDTYKGWLDNNVNPSPKFYDFGHGRKRVHTIFADSIKDEAVIREFITNDLEFDGSQYNTADEMVLAFNKELSYKYPTVRYYDSDLNLYGVIEYWATAKETIEKLRAGSTSYDCDDSMVLRYSCLYYLLKDNFSDDSWRLRGFIVDLWVGGGHALLGWVKEGVNDWIPIETTFYDRRNSIIWNEEYRIDSQMLYQIRYSFDNETEYVKI